MTSAPYFPLVFECAEPISEGLKTRTDYLTTSFLVLYSVWPIAFSGRGSKGGGGETGEFLPPTVRRTPPQGPTTYSATHPAAGCQIFAVGNILLLFEV